MKLFEKIRGCFKRPNTRQNSQVRKTNNDYGVGSYNRKKQIVLQYKKQEREDQINALIHRLETNERRAFEKWHPVLYDTITNSKAIVIIVCAHENHYDFEIYKCDKGTQLIQYFIDDNAHGVGDGLAFPLGYYMVEPFSKESDLWKPISINCREELTEIKNELQDSVGLLAIQYSNQVIDYLYLCGTQVGLGQFTDELLTSQKEVWIMKLPDPIATGEVRRERRS